MALWGNNDSVGSLGTVTLTYSTGQVVGSGTSFGAVGAAGTGDVIRFGIRGDGGTYFGDAVIVGIASTTVCTIGSTAGLSGAAIAATSFTVSQLPKYTILDSKYSEASYGTSDSLVYGIGRTDVWAGSATSYRLDGEGWVGVTTYVDSSGALRVKKEILVAMSGISTGDSIHYPTPE
jgi:hypothetical protein